MASKFNVSRTEASFPKSWNKNQIRKGESVYIIYPFSQS